MSNAFVQVPPQSTGLKMQTFENTVGVNLVEAEAVTLVRSSDNTEVGVAAQPVRVDPTGTTTQPVSGTVSVTSFANPLPVTLTSTTLTGTSTVAGNLTNNNAAPAATNIGTLSALANAANPTWTEGDQVLASVDLSGHLRAVATGTVATGASASGNPVLIAGKDIVNGNAYPIPVGSTGNVLVTGLSATLSDAQSNSVGQVFSTAGTGLNQGIYLSLFNGTTWDRARTAGIGNAIAATGIQANAAYGEYLSTAPAPTTGQYSALQTDHTGSVFVKPCRRSQTVAQATTITSSAAATTALAAQAAGVFADISTLVITVTPAATTDLAFTATLSDGTNSFIYDMDTGALATATADPTIINVTFNPPLPATTAATAWTVQLSVATVTVHITIVAVLQKAS